MDTAETIVTLVTYYLYAGCTVAAIFLLFGVDRVEPSARGAYAFRPLVAPGVILLWPLVLWRWIALERARAEQGDG
ncbi:MAG: hypothetical protein AAFX39_16830 [Pseudomonadota bacterium]